MNQAFEMPKNYQQKCLCVLLLDRSGSMKKDEKIDRLNEAIRQFYENIIFGKNGIEKSTKDRLYVEAIAFDQSPKRLHEAQLLYTDMEIPKVVCRDSTTDTARALDFAIKEIEEHKLWCAKTGQKYYRPWLLLITDGKPTSSDEEMDRIAQKVKTYVAERKMCINAIGVGNKVSIQSLNKLSAGNGKILTGYNFSDFFRWLSESTESIFKSNDEFDRAWGASGF